jgi:hypothetical protein
MISLYANQPFLGGQLDILTKELNDQTTGIIPDNVHNILNKQLFHLERAVLLLGDGLQVLAGRTQVLLRLAGEVHFYRVDAFQQVFSFGGYAETCQI